MSRNLSLQPPQFAELPATSYSSVSPRLLNRPYWVAFNPCLAEALGLDEDLQTASNLAYLSGSAERYQPQLLVAMCNGHQLGAHTLRLGDGCVLLLGDSEDRHGWCWEWQLKGAGETPYSHFVDGRAVLRSSIREYLCSEAMHGLGIPATCALALCGSQDPVYRKRQETAVVSTRIASSFIRFGHFRYLSYQGRETELKLLADFLIRHHYPDCRVAANPYAGLLYQTGLRTAPLTAVWQSIGSCHGVLNIGNMSALGLTIGYGPFGFMDIYDRHHASNHSDGKGRYAYNAQPYTAYWNFSALANCFESLVSEEFINRMFEQWPDVLQTAYLHKMRGKFGLRHAESGDNALTVDLFAALQDGNIDFTLFFRHLAKTSHVHGDLLPIKLENLFGGNVIPMFNLWLGLYRRRLRGENSRSAERVECMNRTSPLYVLYNRPAEQVIVLTQSGDYREIERLRHCLENPFEERAEFADFAEPPPAGSMSVRVSCSS